MEMSHSISNTYARAEFIYGAVRRSESFSIRRYILTHLWTGKFLGIVVSSGLRDKKVKTHGVYYINGKQRTTCVHKQYTYPHIDTYIVIHMWSQTERLTTNFLLKLGVDGFGVLQVFPVACPNFTTRTL